MSVPQKSIPSAVVYHFYAEQMLASFWFGLNETPFVIELSY